MITKKIKSKIKTALFLGAVLFFSFTGAVGADAPAPEKIYPTDGLEDLPTTITLKWNAVAGAEKGYHYGIWLYDTQDLIKDGTIDETEVSVDLQAGRKYYWNVQSCWNSGLFGWGRTCGDWGDPWVFTVQKPSQACQFSGCDGYNWEPCICGQTPISGGYCCSTYNNGQGAAFDSLDCTVRLKCPNVAGGVKSCDQTTECQQQFSGNCICGTEMINNQFCCARLSKGFYDQNDCKAECALAPLVCQNSSCQQAESATCLCGAAIIEAGQFCCAASADVYKAYRYSQAACQADSKCSVAANTCERLYGTWCAEGLYCDGTDLTSKASDKENYPNQVCCFGNCTTVQPTPSPSVGGPALPPARTNCPTTGLVPCGNATCPCRLCDFFVLFDSIVKFLLFKLLPPLAFLMVLIIGAMFFMAAGDLVKMEKVKALIKSVVIGLLVVYGSWIIINTFFMGMGVAEWTGLTSGWFNYPCR